jgi:vitamin B12 transporter
MRAHALFILLAALATPALAEEEADLVVTATRTPARAERLPAAVTVIDIDAARSDGLSTLAETLAAAPGLHATPAGGPGQQTSLFAGGANSNHTLVLFDGVRVNDPSTPGSSFDAGQDETAAFSRIEIVQGPMSALYGSDAIGGVVNLLARHGGPQPLAARLSLAAGEFETVEASAWIDGTLGGLRFALTAEGFATGGYDLVPARMSTHTGDPDGAEMAAITGVFDLNISDALTLDLLLRRREARADFDPFLFDASFNEFRGDDADLEIARNDQSLARLGATWTISEAASVRVSGGTLTYDRAQSDGGAVTDRFAGDRDFGEITLDWRAARALGLTDAALVVGVGAEKERIDVAQGFVFPPPSFFTAAGQEQRSAFVTGQGGLGGVTLAAALRVDDYEGFGANTVWRLGAAYDIARFARIHAAYGTSFRAPTLYERFVSFGDPALEPEEAESWEAGANLRWPAFGRDDGLAFGALYRSTDIDNLIDFGPAFTFANVERATIQTAQTHVRLTPLPWLGFEAGHDWTDATDEGTGLALLRRPAHAWNAAVAVDAGAVHARLAWRRVGERRDQLYGDDGVSLGQGNTPAYEVARLSVRYAFMAGLEAYIAADNLFDEVYEPANAFAGAPQSVMLGLRLHSD